MSRLDSEERVVAVAKEVSPYLSYERPVLIPVGNLNDLLAGSGTGNADPGGGMNPPTCIANGSIVDTDDCGT